MANEMLLNTAALKTLNLGSVEFQPRPIDFVGPLKPPVQSPPAPVPTPAPPVQTTPAPTPQPEAPPAPAVPAPPSDSPFAHLPFPSPGDRIKADDFKALSQSLNIIYNMVVLSGSLVGFTFAEAKAALTGQRYSIQRVMTVFGNELTNLADTSLDSRKVVQVVPVAPGDARVMVVVTEAVDTRRIAPDLVGLTYRDAANKIQTLLADVTITGAPPSAPQLTGLTLTGAQQNFFK
jgi:hypothetical protein